MTRIRTALALSVCLSSVSSFVGSKTAEARVTVDGQSLEVIDMHLHPGHFGQMASGGREFVVASTPEFARIYAPAVFENLLDPYASTIGIAAQSAWAGTDHVLLYAVYTQRTSGYLTNQQLDGFLRDGQNRALGGEEPWAWGLASIDFFDGYEDPAIARRRLDVLASWLE